MPYYKNERGKSITFQAKTGTDVQTGVQTYRKNRVEEEDDILAHEATSVQSHGSKRRDESEKRLEWEPVCNRINCNGSRVEDAHACLRLVQ